MKYFKSHRVDEDKSFVLFNCINKANSFVNYLETIGVNKSRIYKREECIDWFRDNYPKTRGYDLVYGRDISTGIVKSFFELMED